MVSHRRKTLRNVFMFLMIISITVGAGVGMGIEGVMAAKSGTGTITGTIVSTSITVNAASVGNVEADGSSYYFYRSDGTTGGIGDGASAPGIQAFASVDFGMDEGTVEVSLGTDKTLPNSAKIYLDDDTAPNSNTATDSNQIQLNGDAGNTVVISYAGEDSNNKLNYDSDGQVYAFINTGSATSGGINVDISLTATST